MLFAVQFRVGHDHAVIVPGFALAVAVVAAQPRRLAAPIHIAIRLPRVFTPSGEPQRFEAHGFERDVARENHQVGPGDLPTILLLDRPEQAPRLIQAHVVRPTVERRETLLAPPATAAPIADSVGAGAVPGHADEQRTIVAEVRRPPILRVGHQRIPTLSRSGQLSDRIIFSILPPRSSR